MNCLPHTGFSSWILVVAVVLLLAGAVLLALSRGMRAGMAAMLVVALVSVGAVLPAEPARADGCTSQPPTQPANPGEPSPAPGDVDEKPDEQPEEEPEEPGTPTPGLRYRVVRIS